jgi:hypothetical protein
MLGVADMRDPIRMLSWLIVIAGVLLVGAYVLFVELQPLVAVRPQPSAPAPPSEAQRLWPGIVAGGVVALLGGLMLLLRRWGRSGQPPEARPGSNGHP